MNDWPVGTIARATVRGVENVTVFRCAGSTWLSSAMIPIPVLDGASRAHEDDHVTDVRPLVVLDPKDFPVPDVAGLLRAVASERIPASGRELTLLWIADEWEKQTAPPRMDEPGWGEKVIAHTAGDPTRREFVRYGDLPYRWSARDACDGFRWDDLLDPRPVGGDS